MRKNAEQDCKHLSNNPLESLHLRCRMMPTSHMPLPRPSYTQARENLVRAIPSRLLCLLACGGRDCRYEGPECWKASQQAIRGLFSSW